MQTYLLDTNILIDVINARYGRSELIEGFLKEGILLACTTVNITEVYMGMRPHEAEATERFPRTLEYYPITWEIARYAGQLYCDWRAQGKTLSLADVTIAAVCLTHNLTLVTDNEKHFPMVELNRYPLPRATA